MAFGLGYTISDVAIAAKGLPRRVKNILKKYSASAIIPGAAEPILGPELVVNGDGSTVAGWTIGAIPMTSDGTKFTIVRNGEPVASAPSQNIVIAGRKYAVSVEVVSLTASATASIYVGGTELKSSQSYTGVLSGEIVAGSDGLGVRISSSSLPTSTISFKKFSVREILGYSNTYASFQSGNYVESTGQTLTAIDKQVGLVVDAAGGAIEMAAPSTGSTSGWASYLASVTSNGTDLTITNSSASEGYAYFQQGNILANKKNKIEFEVVSRTITAGTLQVGQTFTSVSGVGKFSATVKATNTHGIWIGVGGSTAGNSVTIRNVKLWELPGIHASQATDGYKPIERRGLVNLLTYSNDFSNAVWGKTSCTYSGGKLIEASGTGLLPYARNAYSCLNSTTYTSALRVKAAERTFICLEFNHGTGTASARIDLQTGVVTNGGRTGVLFSSVTAAQDNDGYWTIAGVYTTTGTTNHVQLVIGTGATYTGDGVSGVFVSGGALFAGTVTAQQILDAGGIPVTTSAPASSDKGVNYFEFDGVDDRLQLSAVPFQMADDHWVVVAHSPAALQKTAFSPARVSNTYRIATVSTTNGGNHIIEWYDGTNYVNHQTPCVLNAPCIVSAVGVGGDCKSRLNGVQFGASAKFSTVDPTSGVVGGIGEKILGAWNGQIHAVFFGKGAITDAELLTLERFAAQLQGRTIYNGESTLNLDFTTDTYSVWEGDFTWA